MLGHDVIVGYIPNKECRFAIDVMYAIENIPNGLLIVLEGRIEKVRPVTFEIGRSSFSHFEWKIGLNIAKQLLRVREGCIFETKVSFIVEYLGKFKELIDDFW